MGYFTTGKTTKKRDQCISRKQVEIETLKAEVEKWMDFADSMERDNRRLVMDLDFHKHEIREMEGYFLERHRVVMATNEMLMESLAHYAGRNQKPSIVLNEVVK